MITEIAQATGALIQLIDDLLNHTQTRRLDAATKQASEDVQGFKDDLLARRLESVNLRLGGLQHGILVHLGPTDLALWWFSCLFLAEQPRETTGLARRLNPRAYYLAMRWDYAAHSKTLLRETVVRVSNPTNKRRIFARPVDFGPGDGSVIDGANTPDTGRIADLSPGAAAALDLRTDDVVRCELMT